MTIYDKSIEVDIESEIVSIHGSNLLEFLIEVASEFEDTPTQKKLIALFSLNGENDVDDFENVSNALSSDMSHKHFNIPICAYDVTTSVDIDLDSDADLETMIEYVKTQGYKVSQTENSYSTHTVEDDFKQKIYDWMSKNLSLTEVEELAKQKGFNY